MTTPWVDAGEWQAINQAFRYLVQHHKSSMQHIFSSASRLAELFGLVFYTADELCHSTCRHCPDPCCAKAWAWFDFKDLLFMHLIGLEIPESQTLSFSGDQCRYLGNRGCRLPRIARPWICTWYYCPPQVARMKSKPAVLMGTFERIVRLVKQQRLELETAFVGITIAGTSSCRNGYERLNAEMDQRIDIQLREASPESLLPINWI